MSEISIIVPVFKVEKYLARCIESILAQTFIDLELILIDDGSPDNCGKICDEYAKKDNRITVIHQQNGGVGRARNVGLQNATGNYISFVDADDYIAPECMETLFKLIMKHNVKCSACGYIICSDDEILNGKMNFSEVIEPETLFLRDRRLVIVPWAKLFSKKLFSNILFPEVKAYEDIATIFKIIFSIDCIAVTDLKGYAYYQNRESITNGKWTSDRLFSITAARIQVEFFIKNNFLQALKSSIASLYFIEVREYNNAAKYGTKKEKKDVRKCLYSDLKKYKKYKVLNFKEMIFYYLRVIPIGIDVIKIHSLIKLKKTNDLHRQL